MPNQDTRNDVSNNVQVAGHIRQPILPREPSTLETLTNALSSLSTRVLPASASNVAGISAERRLSLHAPELGGVAFPTSPMAPFSTLEEQFAPQAQREYFTRARERERESIGSVNDLTLGAFGEREEIVWSGFDNLQLEPRAPPKRVLMIVYVSGFQMWDTTDPDNALEILNLREKAFLGLDSAMMLPTPLPSQETPDEMYNLRPLLALVRGGQPSIAGSAKLEVVLYSLRTNEIVKTIPFSRRGSPGRAVIAASDRYLVVGTSQPPALHVFSASSLSPVLTPITDIAPHPITQLPVFTLGTRLLAYATTRILDSGQTGIITRESQGNEVIIAPSATSTVLEIGKAAQKVGGGVFSGVKTLGGMGYAYFSGRGQETSRADESPYKPYSRSAPQPSTFLGNVASLSALSGFHPPLEELRPSGKTAETGFVSVVDLDGHASGKFRQLAHFRPSAKPTTILQWNPTSSLLFVTSTDGRAFNIYEMRNKSRLASDIPLPAGIQEDLPHVWHRYELKRGSTPATVVRAIWSPDGRWLAVGTQRRTVHLYALSPYFGPPSTDTHGNAKIRNPTSFQQLSCIVHPIVRFHFSRATDLNITSGTDNQPSTTTSGLIAMPSNGSRTSSGPQLALSFLPRHSSLSSRLIPHPQLSAVASPYGVPSPNTRSPQLQPVRSPPMLRRPSSSSSFSGNLQDLILAYFQDVLVFNPADGMMSLQRCLLSQSSQSAPVVELGTPSSGGTPLNDRTPSSSFSSQRIPNLGALLSGSASGRGMENLIATANAVASWNLERDMTWPEVRQPLQKSAARYAIGQLGRNALRNGWLANAEIETCSQSTRILPRSIYQAHQFDFFALPEDYKSKVRNYELDMLALRIEVRQAIEIRPLQRRPSLSSISGQDETAIASSFDEPIASAMRTVLDAQATTLIIPAYPNAVSPRTVNTWLDPGPVRSVANSLQEGLHEGFGLLKKEITRVRAHKRRSISDQFDNSLRFDENDTIFETVHHEEEETAREEEEWERDEEADYRRARDNDRFDDLIVGVMDEEEEERKAMAARVQQQPSKPKPTRRNGRHRKGTK
ncbi:hypothetical protein DACRYDRAFT_115899 [Dacryopinax primogenitus]|uniref:BCAS3 WD40 domain-containing protein n=1 Tax=Dacryopinax primogenitus (strain DJM 731) TaxID=1858805 RepID=M5GD24_DACPD|nr:uncharacterized protein DACRYDRAFT_115899 [Dacryopinax primogenitus]EJU02108.1 hypothetical protein DACRYDRAFT_115899 [Dacryopinax primogenitus]